MQLFTPEQLRNEDEKRGEELEFRRDFLLKEIKDLSAKLHMLQGDYKTERQKSDQDFAEYVEMVSAKKSILLKELHQVEIAFERKKDLYYQLVEKQDELDQRDADLSEREELLRRREQFVLLAEQRLKEKV